jgi:hypothetical protein
MTAVWEVGYLAIAVQKSASHQLSQSEIGSDNPCSRHLSEGTVWLAHDPPRCRSFEVGSGLGTNLGVQAPSYPCWLWQIVKDRLDGIMAKLWIDLISWV